MLTRLWDARSNGTDERLAYALASVAGALDGAGLLAVGVYTTNMTGNVSALARHVATGELIPALGLLTLLASFVAGAAASAILANAGARLGMSAIYAVCILAEAGWLVMLGVADLGLAGEPRRAILAYGLSFAMGLQNAVVTRISCSRIRTTHVTGIATDIGIALGELIVSPRDRDGAANSGAGSGLRLHALIMASFLCGGVAGVLLYGLIHGWLVIGLSGCLLVIVLSGVARPGASPGREDPE
jgi:uncharacterized membrane protein YoaK (UPF0700 family)